MTTEYAIFAMTDIGNLWIGPLGADDVTPTRSLLVRYDGTSRYCKGIQEVGTVKGTGFIKGDNMDSKYIDADTLAIARLVADAEGITLAEAIRDQVELFA